MDASPGWTGGRLELGRLLLELQRPDEALPHLQAAQDWPGMASSHRSGGRLDKALAAYKLALQRRQGDRAAMFLGAALTRRQLGLSGNVGALKRVTELAPDDPAGWYALAQATQEEGDAAGSAAAMARYAQADARRQAALTAAEDAVSARLQRPTDPDALVRLCLLANR